MLTRKLRALRFFFSVDHHKWGNKNANYRSHVSQLIVTEKVSDCLPLLLYEISRKYNISRNASCVLINLYVDRKL